MPRHKGGKEKQRSGRFQALTVPLFPLHHFMQTMSLMASVRLIGRRKRNLIMKIDWVPKKEYIIQRGFEISDLKSKRVPN